MKLPAIKILLLGIIGLSQINASLAKGSFNQNFNALNNINSQWTNHQESVPSDQYFYGTDDQIIRVHLKLVCNAHAHARILSRGR